MKKPQKAQVAHNRRALLLCFLCVLWFLFLSACGRTAPSKSPDGSALEKTHLTIGLAVPGATYLPLYVGVDEGTFLRQGIQADVVEFRGGSDLIKAVVSGSVDIGVVSLAEILSGQESCCLAVPGTPSRDGTFFPEAAGVLAGPQAPFPVLEAAFPRLRGTRAPFRVSFPPLGVP